MKLSLPGLVALWWMLLASAAQAETQTFRNTVGWDSRVEACMSAKVQAQRWLQAETGSDYGRVLGKKGRLIGECDCSTKRTPSGGDEWVCIIDATTDQPSQPTVPKRTVTEMRLFEAVDYEKTNACRAVRGKVTAYQQQSKATLVQVSECDCSMSGMGPPSGYWWTCFVNAKLERQ